MTDAEVIITARERTMGEPALSPEQLHLDRVVITAAVTALFGKPALIRRMRAVPGRGQGEWMREGRLSIQTSHRMAAPLICLPRDRSLQNI